MYKKTRGGRNMSETKIGSQERKESSRESTNSTLSANIRTLISNPEGQFLNRINSLPSTFQDHRTQKLSLPKHVHISEVENSIDKNIKLLLQKVDTLVTTMEKMSKGPIGVDNFRYDAIDHELRDLKKSATKKELNEEQLGTFQSKWFNQKLKEIEFELLDIYKSWLEFYCAIMQESFQLCSTLCTQVSKIKNRKKKQTQFLQTIFEFSTYAAAQRSSIQELLNKTVLEYTEVNSFEEISQRITDLEKRLNTPLPVSFDNVPKLMTEDEKNKRKKPPKKNEKETSKTKKTKKQESVIKSENLQVTFQEPEGSKQKGKRKNKTAKSKSDKNK